MRVVEHDGPTTRLLEQSRSRRAPALGRAPEQLDLECAGVRTGTAHRDEWTRGTLRQIVHQPRDDVLARPLLSRHEDRRARRRGSPDLLSHEEDRGRPTDQGMLCRIADAGPQHRQLAPQLSLARGPLDRREQCRALPLAGSTTSVTPARNTARACSLDSRLASATKLIGAVAHCASRR